MHNYIPDYCKCHTVVFGCGNIFYGDDGFGVETISYIKENYKIPKSAILISAGTSIRKILFNILLSEVKPKKIIIVDAYDIGKKDGEVFEIDLDKIPIIKTDDFSMHQLPTSNMLKELRDICKVEVKVFACQPKNIPREMEGGLSKEVAKAVKKISKIIAKEINAKKKGG